MQRLARTIGRFTLVLVLLAATIAPPGVGPARAVALAPDAALSAAGAPVFIENVGQFDPEARFLMRDGGATLWLAQDALWLTALGPAPQADPGDRLGQDRPQASEAAEPQEPRQGVHLRLSFVGANPAPRIEPFGRSATRVSYFIGSDPSAWRPDVPVWGGVRYVNLYPGLDLEVTGAGGQWTWRLVANGGLAALSAVQLRVEGAELLQAEAGYLGVSTAVGALALPLLEVVNAQGQALAADVPRVEGQVIAAPFGVAVTTQGPPAAQAGGLVYSTFLGGSGLDRGGAIAVDGQGRAYVAGITSSTDYPTTPGAYDRGHSGGDDVFVSVLDPTGATLVYSTFLGGSGQDWGIGIAVDGQGRAYVAGYTNSTDYPTTDGAYDRGHNGGDDLFVSVLDPTGATLVYSTLLGGGAWDRGGAIAVDGQGHAYVAGITSSTDYPTTPGAYNRTHNGSWNWDVFVTVLDPTGTGLVYSTLLGGSGQDWGLAIAVDGAGRAYVTGITSSTDYPTTDGAYDRGHNGGDDLFVSVLDPTGATLVYSTLLGGGAWDRGEGIAVDGQGRAYVGGSTGSSDYPITPGAFDGTFVGSDAFVTVLDPTGATMVYSTFLGGSAWDQGGAIAVDGQGRAYVTGATASTDYPTTPGAYDTGLNGGNDLFVSVLDPTGATMVYSTLLGGSANDRGFGIAVDGAGRAYVTGTTASTDYPTTPGAYDTGLNGGDDAFVTALQVFAPLDRFTYLPITRR